MLPQGIGQTGAVGNTAGANQAAPAQDGAATQAQFDQSVNTVLASILSPMVQLVLANTGE